MNVSVLKKIESGWIKLDWAEYIHKIPLTEANLERVIDIIDNFKSNRRAKELVLFKYKHLPAYITVEKRDYVKLLDVVYKMLVAKELYEHCNRLLELKEKLCLTS